MPVLVTAAAVVAGTGVLGCAAPYLSAALVSKTLRIMLRDDNLRSQLQLAADETEQTIAKIAMSRHMRQGLQEAMIEIANNPGFHESMKNLVAEILITKRLKDTICEGVMDAMGDESVKSQMKAIIVDNINDPELQYGVTKAAIGTIKTAIREGLSDNELQEALTAVISEALADPRLKGIIRGVARDALADKDLYRAGLTGAVSALNPISSSTMAAWGLVPSSQRPTPGPVTAVTRESTQEPSPPPSRGHSPRPSSSSRASGREVQPQMSDSPNRGQRRLSIGLPWNCK